MLGESMTARKSSSWWTSICLLRLLPTALTSGLARVGAISNFSHPREIASHSTLRTHACANFHPYVSRQFQWNHCPSAERWTFRRRYNVTDALFIDRASQKV